MRKTSSLTTGSISTCLITSIVAGVALFAIGFYLGQISGRQQERASLQANVLPKLNPQPMNQPPGQMAPPPGAPPGAPPNPMLSPNASPEMRELMQTRNLLNQKLAEYRARIHQTDPTQVPTPDQIKEFQKENAELLNRQQQLTEKLEEQLYKNPLPEPPPLQFPPNATPEQKAFLTTRDKIMRSQIIVMNKNRTVDAATRKAAMQAWQKENAGLIQQLQNDEAAMVKSNKNAPPPMPTPSAPPTPPPGKQ